MKHVLTAFATLLLAVPAQAQTMNVVVGSVTYRFPASQTGEMTYDNGTTLTVMGKEFALNEVTQIYIDDAEVTDNSVQVTYNGTEAAVVVAGNVAQYITPAMNGAHVGITQGDVSSEVTYTLSGSSTDGEFYLKGSYKCTVELDGLTLANATPLYSGAAVYVENGKRIDISVKKGTMNTLTDCAGGSQKGCLWVKGHAEFKGKGTLNINGMSKHGIKTGEYMTMKNCTINVLQAAGDGIHASEYFLMESGELNISGTADDGVQAELDGSVSTGETSGHEGEDSGNIYIEDGTVTAVISTAAAKGLKASGDMRISGGTLTVTTTGSYAYDSADKDYKGCACLKTDGNMTISGGTLTLKSTGTGGKCIKADAVLTVSGDAVISATATGSNYKAGGVSAKAVKAGTRTSSGSGRNVTYTYSGGLVVSGGTITASASSHEAIESKSTIDISGGTVYAYSSDDAINSASDFTISGGFVMGNSTGNDGLDANGDFYVKGGTVFAVAASSPEVGIDANTEEQHKLFVTGGNIVAIGGLENGSSLTQSCQQASSYSKGTWYGLYQDNTLVLAYKVPSNSRMGTPMVVSTGGTTSLKSGITVSGGTEIWNGFGFSDATASGGSAVSLSSYTGGQGGHGGGPGGGGGGHWGW